MEVNAIEIGEWEISARYVVPVHKLSDSVLSLGLASLDFVNLGGLSHPMWSLIRTLYLLIG